jgi:glycosyltransferase involved in cell wall biosynthesis
MPVHNALPHLDEAVESILGQSFSEFDFVILDDASTDGSTDRLRHWAAIDRRIRLIEVKENLGPVGSSNRVATAATAPFVARMDADDVSYLDRFSEELKLLRAHPEVGIVASVSDMIDESGRKMRDPEVWRLSRPSVFVPFAHGAMMYRRDVFEKVGGYREECEFWEDQDLVVRMANISKVLVVPRPLYRVRQSTTSTRVVCNQERVERAVDLAYRATDRLREGKDYESLVTGAVTGSQKLDPRVFIAAGSVRLWAGDKPRLFRRILSRGKLSWNFQTVAALVWTAWASTNPSSLRAFLMFLLRVRNRSASKRLPLSNAVVWQPRTQQ